MPSSVLRRALPFAVALAALGACAPATQGAGGASSRHILLPDEIATVAATDAYQAVSRLRPEWLRSRGVVSIGDPRAGDIVVYLDGVRFGGTRSLQGIRVESIVAIEYLDPSDATARFGTGHLGGVIMVRTR